MSDAHTESGSSGATEQGNSGTQTPPPNGSGDGGNWLDGLSEGNRTLATTKGWNAVDEALSGYAELESKLGSAVTVPGADATPEEWQGFYAKLPEERQPVADSKDIAFKRPDDLPAEMPYSEDLAEAAKGWMVEEGIPKAAVQGLHDRFAKFQAEQYQAAASELLEQTKKAVEETHSDLVKEWGPQDGDAYKQHYEAANRAVKKLGLVDAFKQSGILLEDGTVTNAQVAKAMAAVGGQMFVEDTLGDSLPAGGVNPWKHETQNLTQQSAIAKSDPAKAKRLIREAGRDPADYGL